MRGFLRSRSEITSRGFAIQEPGTPEPSYLAAQGYAARQGWRVVPIKPGEKRPALTGWQNLATTDLEQIMVWWTGQYRGHGVGIATGPGSGIWVLDVDVAGDKNGAQTLLDLEAHHGPLPSTVTAITGSGGRHFFFAWPAGVDVRNNQSGKLGPGLDVRGDGGQVVAAPTVHPNGTAYTWHDGCAPDQIDVAPAPGWLLDLLTAEPEMMQGIWPAPAGTATVPSPGPDDQSDSIAAWFNDTTTWDQLLTADGWTRARGPGDEQRWTRPGKSARDGISATVGHQGRDVLKVFTSSVPELSEAGPRGRSATAYSRFDYVVAVHHHDDASAAARDIRQRRNAVEGVRHDDLSWPQVNAAGTVPLSDSTPLEPTDLALPADELQEPDHGWLPADLAAITAAGYEQPRPTLLRRDDGACMFYAGRMNGLFGESGSGKSWLALLTAAQEIKAGHHVLYVDLEDHAASVCGRMIALGVTVDQLVELFFYISPNIPWTDAAAAWTGHRIQQHDTTLAVIDSTGEAMALDGAKPNDDDATATWFRKLPRFLARLGVTVLLIDHQPKNEEGGRHTEIGSQRKRAAIDGASYHVEAPVSPARGVEGHLKLTCVKDRNGTWQKGALVADIDVQSNAAGTEVRIAVKRHEKVTRPTFLMQKISEYLEALGPQGSNQRGIEANVKGKGTGIRKAIEVLITEGYVNQDVRGGSRGFLYTSIQPFRDESASDGMDMFVVDNPGVGGDDTATASPRPPRVPTASLPEGTHSGDRVPRVPPPIRKGAGRDAVPEKSKDTQTTATPPVDNDEGAPWTLI